jgi:hypothetical protein
VPQVSNPAGAGGALVFTNTPNWATKQFWHIRSVPGRRMFPGDARLFRSFFHSIEGNYCCIRINNIYCKQNFFCYHWHKFVLEASRLY